MISIILSFQRYKLTHVSAGILKEPVWRVENYKSYLAVTQYTQLVGLFHKTKFAKRSQFISLQIYLLNFVIEKVKLEIILVSLKSDDPTNPWR